MTRPQNRHLKPITPETAPALSQKAAEGRRRARQGKASLRPSLRGPEGAVQRITAHTEGMSNQAAAEELLRLLDYALMMVEQRDIDALTHKARS